MPSNSPSAKQISQPSRAILIFCKPPIPGKAKTRLEPLLGPRGAARAQRELAEKRLATLVDYPADLLLLAADGGLQALGHVVKARTDSADGTVHQVGSGPQVPGR